MSTYVSEDHHWGGFYATQVDVSERDTHSQLLGPDGKPLQYKQPPKIGFDLTPRGQK